MRKFAIYSRKSRFTGKGESIENQVELCRQYIASHHSGSGAEIVVYEDEGFSGGTLERPSFRAMMSDAENQAFSAIVCYRLDRISRNIADFASLIEHLGALEIGFISIKEQFDTSSPMGRAMMYIASVFSQLERETIAERIRDNMHELAKTGRWLGGVTPTGYLSERTEKVTVDGKVKKACRLKLHPQEAELVQLIFQCYLNTNSLTQTETYLLQHACRTKNGKRFTRFTIKNILTNPVYMIADTPAYEYFLRKEADLFSAPAEFDGTRGMMAYNRTIQKQGKANQLRPVEEWIVSVGAHPGLIAPADWIRVQEQLERNRDSGYRKPRSHDALLSGLLFCARCGDYMRPKRSGRANGQGGFRYSYLCSLKEKSRSHSCAVKNADGAAIDQLVMETLQELSEDRAEWQLRLSAGGRAIRAEPPRRHTLLSQLRRSSEETEQELQKLTNALQSAPSAAAEAYVLEQIDQLLRRKAELRQCIEKSEDAASAHLLTGEELNRAARELSSFGQLFEVMSVDEKRTAIRTLIRRVTWDGETVHLYLTGSETETPEGAVPEHLQKPLCENRK